MTSAAMQAKALDECLSRPGDLARTFFKKAAAVVDIPWGIAVGADLKIPETQGPRTKMVNFINWYIDRLHQAAHHDAELTIAFHKVANLLAPPPSLLTPRLAWKVWRGSRTAGHSVGVGGGLPADARVRITPFSLTDLPAWRRILENVRASVNHR